MKKTYSLVVVIALVMSISCNIVGSSTDTPTPALASIRGILWHEICEYTGGEGGEPVVLGQGCVQWGTAPEEFGPNQVKDNFETGWAGVTLHLGSGACPSTGLATAITNASGEYQFAGLSAGSYCVSYGNLADGNDAILIPGGPTFPARGDDGFFVTINLLTAEEKTVDFGYAWQFYD
jgi:SdrD B-like protein